MYRDARLIVVAYHYVRDLPRTRFPRINGLMLDKFRAQVTSLSERHEMATLEVALEFLAGRYRPRTDLCLLTFDDGLKEHHAEVLPILLQRRIQGLFFPATACLDGHVAPVHKVHFLMAELEFADYRRAFLERLEELRPGLPMEVPEPEVTQAYPWDRPEVGALKYLANYVLTPSLRDAIVDDMFASYLGAEAAFAESLYLSWDELGEMQACGMLAGGHSHSHLPLSGVSPQDQRADLSRCFSLLQQRLRPQEAWPFAYPYGQYDVSTIQILQQLGFVCSFTVEAGLNDATQDLFQLRRLDTNHLSLTDRRVDFEATCDTVPVASPTINSTS